MSDYRVVSTNGEELIKCHFTPSEIKTLYEGLYLMQRETNNNPYFPKEFAETASGMLGKMGSYLKKARELE